MTDTQPRYHILTPREAEADYNRDVARRPTYPNGKPRVSWDELSGIAKASWMRRPYASG